MGFQLKKAGVILLDLSSSSGAPGSLNSGEMTGKDQTQLMMTVDQLNRRFGGGAVSVGGTGMGQRRLEPKTNEVDRKYTTKPDIPVARA